MEEIKVGEYVRNVFGYIYKLENLNDYDFLRDKFYNNIVKHSKNIKDLVQAEDVIVYTIKGLEHSTYIDIVKEHTDARTLKSKFRVGMYFLEQLNIKQILTKEQFERESYKVEEE